MRLSRRSARWLLPIAVASSAAVAAGLPSLLPAGADPVPVLPELTAAQLVAKVQAADVTAFSGTLSFQANLGLPDLSGMLRTGSAPSTVLDLLAGTHTAKVSIDGAEHQRIALDGPQSETDWIHNGTDLWSWNSTTNAVKHATVPADHGDHADDPDHTDEPSGRGADPARPEVLPGDMTADLLDTVGQSTDISVRTPGYVADRPVYELVLAPKAAASTVADIVVDVDASTGMPLQIKVEAKDSTKPVLQLGFTAISYDQPAASVFAFTPPPGATVTEASSPAELVPFGHSGERRHGGRGRDGADGTTPATPPTEGSMPAVPDGTNGMGGLGGMGLGGGNTSMVEVGSDWSTMAVVSGLNLPAQYAMLLGAGTEVSTPSGPARLIHTRLINILLLDDGRLAIAALDPAAMAAAIPAA